MQREQQDDHDLGWVADQLRSSTEPPSYDVIRPLSGTIKTLIAQWPQLALRNNVLYRAWLNSDSGQIERWQLIPPPGRRTNLIRLAHQGMTGGHLGLRRTSAQLKRRVYWPFRNQAAVTVAKVLCDQFISRFGCPRQLLTDQGPCFESHLFQDLCRRLQIDKIRTSPYKASTNGMVERFHRTLNSMLGKVVSRRQKDWDTCLPGIMAAYRATPHSSTGYSPNLLFTGRETIAPIDLVLSDNFVVDPVGQDVDSFVQSKLDQMQETSQLARSHLQRNARFRSVRYNLRVKPATFLVGQWVWYHCPRRTTGVKDKWAKYYDGPYKVLEQLGPVLYRIQKSARAHPKNVYVDKLKPFAGDAPRDWNSPTSPVGIAEDEPLGIEDLEVDDREVPVSRPKRSLVLPARFRD